MDEYPSNSKPMNGKSAAPKTPEKKTEKVVTGKVKIKKKNEMHKLADVFISEDVHKVKSFVLVDVLVPAIKKAVSDIVTNGIDMILYGESGRSKKNGASSNISYRNYYEKDRDRGYARGASFRSSYSCDDIILETRGEAEKVLSDMDDLISIYKIVSIGDLNDLLGITGNYTDNRYGWTDIRSASIVPVRDGYLLKLPKAMPLD